MQNIGVASWSDANTMTDEESDALYGLSFLLIHHCVVPLLRWRRLMLCIGLPIFSLGAKLTFEPSPLGRVDLRSKDGRGLCASEGSPLGRAPAIAGERGLRPLTS